MGRELKRVPMDFDCPVDSTWKGYLNPHYEGHCIACPDCEGTGESEQARHLKKRWYGYVPFKPEDRGSKPFGPDHPIIRARAERNVSHAPQFYGTGEVAVYMEAIRLSAHFNGSWSHHLNEEDVAVLLAEGRLRDLTHTWVPDTGWVERTPAVVPTPAEVNAWSLQGMGHDSTNQWLLSNAECARHGWPTTCPSCNGEGHTWDSPENEEKANNWTRTGPPQGEGYQLWQTVSEGGPISPVFATPHELATWLVANPWGADKGTTYESWMNFIAGPGWAPSFVGTQEGLVTGVQGTGPQA